MKRRIQAADSIRFCVRGRGAQRLLGQAAQAGLKLERIAPQADGFTAVVSGAGWAKLCQLAGAGGWQVIQMQRRGPGPLAERLLRRPGILAGIGLFFVLLHWLGGFLWCMNLELLTVPQQESIRTLLAQSGIWEGCRPSQAKLAQAQQLLEASGDFGWVSLNFTGGCLTAEGTPLQQAQAEPPAQNTRLYARAGGEVLAVNIASGFAQVQPGQYVGNGMLLAAAEKLDRSGAPVPQPASGTVTARVRLAYTGQQAFTQQRPVLTGACAERPHPIPAGPQLAAAGVRRTAGGCSAPRTVAAAAPGAAGFARLRAGNHLLGTGNTKADFHPRNRRSSGTAQRPPAIIAGLPRCRN